MSNCSIVKCQLQGDRMCCSVLLTECLISCRLIRLLEEIMSEKENKTIIFVETKRRCDDLTRRMRRDG